MNGIQNYMNKKKNKIKTDVTLEEIKNNSNNNKKISQAKDSIELNKVNDLNVNTKKAYDAFRDTCKEIGETSWNGYGAGDMSLAYFTIVDMMERRGMNVPNYDFNSNDPGSLANNNDFLGFIDKMEQFVKGNKELSKNYPKKFFDFTKLYKEKLMQFGCQ